MDNDYFFDGFFGYNVDSNSFGDKSSGHDCLATSNNSFNYDDLSESMNSTHPFRSSTESLIDQSQELNEVRQQEEEVPKYIKNENLYDSNTYNQVFNTVNYNIQQFPFNSNNNYNSANSSPNTSSLQFLQQPQILQPPSNNLYSTIQFNNNYNNNYNLKSSVDSDTDQEQQVDDYNKDDDEDDDDEEIYNDDDDEVNSIDDDVIEYESETCNTDINSDYSKLQILNSSSNFQDSDEEIEIIEGIDEPLNLYNSSSSSPNQQPSTPSSTTTTYSTKTIPTPSIKSYNNIRFLDHIMVDNESKNVYVSQEFQKSIQDAAEKVYQISYENSLFTNHYIKILQGCQKKRNKINIDYIHQWITENIKYPYPTKEEKKLIAFRSGSSIKSISDFLTNIRRKKNPRSILKPENIKKIINGTYNFHIAHQDSKKSSSTSKRTKKSKSNKN